MTDMQGSGDVLIKTDEAGRVRTPAGRRASLLAEFDRSGLSGPKFAALAGIKYQTFAGWLRKRRQGPGGELASPAGPAVSGRWLEAVVEEVPAGGGLMLQLPGGVRVEVGDQKQAALAALLVRALAGPC